MESKNTIVKSNGLSRVLMLNLWIFSLEKNKSENSGLNNLTIYYKLIKTAIKRKYNQINLGTKQYLTLIQSSINPPSIILSQQFLLNPTRIYRVRPYIGPRESSGNYVTLQHQSSQFIPFWKVLNARDDISRRFHTKLR